jgi:hypothetical protein
VVEYREWRWRERAEAKAFALLRPFGDARCVAATVGGLGCRVSGVRVWSLGLGLGSSLGTLGERTPYMGRVSGVGFKVWGVKVWGVGVWGQDTFERTGKRTRRE